MFADLLAHPGVDESSELAGRVGFLALHGGLERGTAEIARAAASRSGASWYSVVQPPDLRWHVPSHRFDPEESPQLARVLDHCDVVVSIHGFGREGLWTTLLLGGDDRPRAACARGVPPGRAPGVRGARRSRRDPRELRGVDPRNPVNRARGGGVQLELPPRVRGMGPHWEAHHGPEPVPHTAALVDALVQFAVARSA